MSPELVNTTGLVANMAGVVLAFFYGYPQPSHEEGVSIGAEDGTRLPEMGGITVAELNERVRRQKAQYLLLSRVGLLLMFAGFALQLIATWIARAN